MPLMPPFDALLAAGIFSIIDGRHGVKACSSNRAFCSFADDGRASHVEIALQAFRKPAEACFIGDWSALGGLQGGASRSRALDKHNLGRRGPSWSRSGLVEDFWPLAATVTASVLPGLQASWPFPGTREMRFFGDQNVSQAYDLACTLFFCTSTILLTSDERELLPQRTGVAAGTVSRPSALAAFRNGFSHALGASTPSRNGVATLLESVCGELVGGTNAGPGGADASSSDVCIAGKSTTAGPLFSPDSLLTAATYANTVFLRSVSGDY